MKNPPLICFLVVLLLQTFSPRGLQMAEAKLCEKRSVTWSGMCIKTQHCDLQCKEWEDALHGACHFQWPGFACFCYVEC